MLSNVENNEEAKKVFGDNSISYTMLKTKIYDSREVVFKRMSVYIQYLPQEVQD